MTLLNLTDQYIPTSHHVGKPSKSIEVVCPRCGGGDHYWKSDRDNMSVNVVRSSETPTYNHRGW